MTFNLRLLAVSLILTLLPQFPAQAQVMPEPDAPISAARQKADLIYRRIAGVRLPIDAPELKQMETLIQQGDMLGAAQIATEDPRFINITVKHFATRISTRDETILAPLSDFVATVMGTVKDNNSAKSLLTADYIYVGDPDRVPANVGTDVVDDLIRSNNHYEDLDRAALEDNVDVGSLLIQQRQQSLNSAGNAVPLPDAAGLLTTRTYVSEHAVAGTNRRHAVHYPFRNFLCVDISEFADTTLPSVYIGRDVDRAPGGVPATFDTTCKGCHSPMDAMRGASAHLDFDDDFVKHGTLLDRGNGDLEFRANNDTPTISEKYANNSDVAPNGYVTTDASWINNLAVFGSKSNFFGWRNMPTNGRGVGLNRYGQMLADSKAFSNCMVKRVYRSVCKRDVTGLEGDFVTIASNEFEKDYNLRNLFKYVATSPACIGN